MGKRTARGENATKNPRNLMIVDAIMLGTQMIMFDFHTGEVKSN